MMIGFLISCNP